MSKQHELAQKIFNEIFDYELLAKMEKAGIIDQCLGFECGTVANITLELEEAEQETMVDTNVTVPSDYPMQPIKDFRFEANPIVDWLCTEVSDMNRISMYAQENKIDAKYQEQLAQLVGYSIGGYSDLSYVTDESYYRAMAIGEAAALKQLVELSEDDAKHGRVEPLDGFMGKI